MTTHNHLTRDIKTEGNCPACDLFWARQQERLTSVPSVEAAIGEVERLAKSLGASRERWRRYPREDDPED